MAAELGIALLAMLGQLPQGVTTEEGLAAVARRLVERLTSEAETARATKLLTSALLLTGLRVDRHAALNIFRGAHLLEESDTYLMILEKGEERGEERARREAILMFGEERFGAADESVRDQLANMADAEPPKRMVRKAACRATIRFPGQRQLEFPAVPGVSLAPSGPAPFSCPVSVALDKRSNPAAFRSMAPKAPLRQCVPNKRVERFREHLTPGPPKVAGAVDEP